MKRTLGFVAVVVFAVFFAPAGRAPAEEPAPADLDAQVKALQQTVAGLQTQIADIQSQVERNKAVADVLKEMGMNPEPNDLRLYWKDGIRMDSRDGQVKLKFGGRLQYDFDWIGNKPAETRVGQLPDGFETRRARLYVSGDLGKNIGFKWEYDWSSGAAVAQDVYLELKQLPVVGTFRVGHFEEPFSLDEQLSTNYLTFMERALPNVLVPAYNGGAMIYNTALEERMTWAAGIFRDTAANDGGMGQRDGQYAFTTRITGLP